MYVFKVTSYHSTHTADDTPGHAEAGPRAAAVQAGVETKRAAVHLAQHSQHHLRRRGTTSEKKDVSCTHSSKRVCICECACLRVCECVYVRVRGCANLCMRMRASVCSLLVCLKSAKAN